MIAIDTNVIVRALVDDDEVQSAAARRMLDGLTPDNPGFICREVVLELVWALESIYKLPRVSIGTAILELISTGTFVVENDHAATHAAYRYMQGGVDFADLMILAAADHQQATPLYTFDRKLSRLDGATLLESA